MNGNQPYPPTGFSGASGAYPPPLPTQGGGFQPFPAGTAHPPGGFARPPGSFGSGYGPQPGAQGSWMPRPTVSSCPPGLEYLTQIDQLLVKQKKELFELITDVETENQYVCYNTLGQMVYHCREESDFFKRQCCTTSRPFTMHINDNMGMEVIRVNRPYKYICCWQCCSCADCCQDELEVQAPVGHPVGYVKQVMNGCDVWYEIRDAERNTVLKIHGPPYCHCSCFGEDINFSVLSASGSAEIGRITKQWTGVIQEFLTDADNFGVTFPMDLDVRVKATLIGAVFLIDFMFFEQNHSSRND